MDISITSVIFCCRCVLGNAGTRKILENILDGTQSYASSCILDALKISLLVPSKTHKIKVVNEPGRYPQTDIEIINTIQSFNRILYSAHYRNLNWACRPWFNKAFRLLTSHWFPIWINGKFGPKDFIKLGLSD